MRLFKIVGKVREEEKRHLLCGSAACLDLRHLHPKVFLTQQIEKVAFVLVFVRVL